jgi:hypothetical protein
MFSMVFATASIAVPTPHATLLRLAAGFLDVGADRVEFVRQCFDVLGGEVRVSLDVGDGHGSSS